MPGHHRRNSLKDSVRRVLGTYSDPLLPPGGLPLPFHIRRKFSFAPQLPDISQLSLIRGFTASQYSLKVDDAPEGEPTTPRTSLIQARPSRVQLVIYEEEKQPAIEHPILFATINDLTRPGGSLRRIRGQDNLNGSTFQTDSISDKHHPFHRNAVPVANAPQQTRPLGKKLGGHRLDATTAVNPPGDRATGQGFALLDSLITKHARIIPNFLRSFYIIDDQLPGNPINVMSHDMIPSQHLQDGEGLFLDLGKSLDSPDLLTRQALDGETEYHLVFSSDLISQETGQTRYRLIAQVNVTHLLTCELLEILLRSTQPAEQDPDDREWTSMDWFEVAHNELLKAGQRSHFGPFPPRNNHKPKPLPSRSPTITALTQALMPFYADFFILQRSPNGKRYYDITYLSRGIFDSGAQACDDPLKHTSPEVTKAFGRGLAREEEVALRIRWGEQGVEKWLYCVPMFGPRLSCFLCFLLDGNLPNFWDN